jgi:hypothetical protein
MVAHRSPMTFAVSAFIVLFFLSTPCLLWPQRLCCEGDTWIKWTEEHREDYVRGYILGSSEGYSQACYKMASYWPSPVVVSDKNNPISKCLKHMPDFAKGPGYFAQQITQLYALHPEDRILLTTEILEALGKGKSLQDIHEHPPFPTQSVSPASSSQR